MTRRGFILDLELNIRKTLAHGRKPPSQITTPSVTDLRVFSNCFDLLSYLRIVSERRREVSMFLRLFIIQKSSLLLRPVRDKQGQLRMNSV